jgi:hypothetical protein
LQPDATGPAWLRSAVRHSMLRLLSFCCLLAALAAIAALTLSYVDPPITDPLVFGFVKSDKYLPAGDTFRRVELYSPVQKLLADDRRAYRSVLWLSGVAVICALVLFLSSASRGTKGEQAASNGGPAERFGNAGAGGGPPSVS